MISLFGFKNSSAANTSMLAHSPAVIELGLSAFPTRNPHCTNGPDGMVSFTSLSKLFPSALARKYPEPVFTGLNGTVVALLPAGKPALRRGLSMDQVTSVASSM